MVWAGEPHYFHLLPPIVSLFSLPLTGKVAAESISREVPADVVPDSTKAYVTVLGKQLETHGSQRKNGARGCQGVQWGGHVNLSEGRCGGLEVTKGKEPVWWAVQPVHNSTAGIRQT